MKEIFFCTRSRSKDFNKQLHLFAQIEILMRCVFDKYIVGPSLWSNREIICTVFLWTMYWIKKKKRIISKHQDTASHFSIYMLSNIVKISNLSLDRMYVMTNHCQNVLALELFQWLFFWWNCLFDKFILYLESDHVPSSL